MAGSARSSRRARKKAPSTAASVESPSPQVAQQASLGGFLAMADQLMQQGGLVAAPVGTEEAARQVHGVLAQHEKRLMQQIAKLKEDASALSGDIARAEALLRGDDPTQRFDRDAVRGRADRGKQARDHIAHQLRTVQTQLEALKTDQRLLTEDPARARSIGLAHGVGPTLPRVFEGWLDAPGSAAQAQTEAERAEQLAVACAVPLERLRAELNSVWVDDETVLRILRGLTPEQRRYVDRRFRDEEGDSLKESIQWGLQGQAESDAEALLAAKAVPRGATPTPTPTSDTAPPVPTTRSEAELEGHLKAALGHFTDGGVLEHLEAMEPGLRRQLLMERGSDLTVGVDGDERAKLQAMVSEANDPGGAEVVAKRKELAATEARKELEQTLWKRGYSAEEIEKKLADPTTLAALGERAAALDRKRVAKLGALAGDLFSGVDGVGDDPAKIYTALRKLPKGEAAFLEDLYRRRYQMDLRTQLTEDMGHGLEGNTAIQLLADDDATRTQGLEGILAWGTSGTDDEKLIFDTLEGLTDAERKHLMGTEKGAGEPRYKALLGHDLEKRELHKAEALLQTDAKKRKVAKASAELGLAMHGFGWWDIGGIGTDKDKVFDTLQDLSKEELAELATTYEAQGGRDLSEDLQWELSGRSEQIAMQELAGEKDEADATRLQVAAQNWGTDLPTDWTTAHDITEWMGLGTDERLMKRTYEAAHKRGAMSQVARQFESSTGRTQASLLDSEFGTHSAASPDAERVMMGQYAAKGKADDALRLFVAYDGLGTDVEEVKAIAKTYADADPKKMARLYRDFDRVAATHGGTREGLLSYHQQDIGGRDGFDLSHQLQGKAQGRADRVRRAQERLEHETSGVNAIGHGYMLMTEDLGLHSKTSAFQRGADAVIAGTIDGRTVSDDEHQMWSDGLAQDHMTYGATRDAVADGIADGASLTAAAALTLLTEGAASPLLLALTGAVTGSATKVMLKGTANTSQEDLAKELASIGIAAGTAGLGSLKGVPGAEKALVARLQSKGMSEAQARIVAKGLISGATGAPGDLATEAMGLDYDKLNDGQLVEKVLLGTARRSLTNAASNSVGQGVDLHTGAGTKTSLTTGLKRGAAQGMVNAVGDDKVQAAVADGQGGKALALTAKSVGKDALSNAATDHSKRNQKQETEGTDQEEDDRTPKVDEDQAVEETTAEAAIRDKKPAPKPTPRTSEPTVYLDPAQALPGAPAPAPAKPLPKPKPAPRTSEPTVYLDPEQALPGAPAPAPAKPTPPSQAVDAHDAPFRPPGRPIEGDHHDLRTTRPLPMVPHEAFPDSASYLQRKGRPEERRPSMEWPLGPMHYASVDGMARGPSGDLAKADGAPATTPVRSGAGRFLQVRPDPRDPSKRIGGKSDYRFDAHDDGQAMTFRKKVMFAPEQGVDDHAVNQVHREMLSGLDEQVNLQGLHLDLDDVGRRRLQVQIERITPADFARMTPDEQQLVHTFRVTAGEGRDNSGQLHVGGAPGSDPMHRRQVRAHELLHTMFGIPDAYSDAHPELRIPHEGIMDGPRHWGGDAYRDGPKVGRSATQLRETDLRYMEWIWGIHDPLFGAQEEHFVSTQLPPELTSIFDAGRKRSAEEADLVMPDAPPAHRFRAQTDPELGLSTADQELMKQLRQGAPALPPVGAQGPVAPGHSPSPLEAADRGLSDTHWHAVMEQVASGVPLHLAIFEVLERHDAW